MIGDIVENRYRIEAELGAGAMGRVYRARHVKVGCSVAIKVLHRELLTVPTVVERFHREARIAARLRHPNVIGVLDVGETAAGQHLMVLELAPGIPLSQLVSAPLPRARTISIIAQLLRGLSHAHAAGLVHRDLKPENVLVETSPAGIDTARIVDFGIAVLRDRDDVAAGPRLTDANLIIGTPHYMSPEHATGAPVDGRTDLFSLGIIVYELLAGCLPFAGSGADVAFANVTRDPPAIAERAPCATVDPLLEAFARRLMARRLDERFQSAQEALAVLELIELDRTAATRLLCRAATAPAVVAYVPQRVAPAVVVDPPMRSVFDSDALSTMPI
ncbi:MAG: serine/threonine protein kinase, partial [Myxococcota bacterium]|nr:serine/threonine protein kinase [Myxococcota bacterium]